MVKDASFARQITDKWHDEVPGARWFKADLHIHTIDDQPGGRAKMPPGVDAASLTEQELDNYARQFLRSAVEKQIRVLGVTPHSPQITSSISAVWRIVTEWNDGVDDDGEPFRNKIYAVFPGFEPALKDGSSGLHLLFLFDPEIGQHNYLKAFHMAMGGVSPWVEGDLRISNKSSSEVFKELRAFHSRESNGVNQWNYVVLAPHIENSKGLLGALKSQPLWLFEHREIAALELGDDKLPEDTVHNRRWLEKGMADYRQAFLHGSDAYSPDDIGNRYTWIKLAKPRIEALRQAFIASDSRIRIAYQKDSQGKLAEIPDAPDVTVYGRPWLKSVTVAGGASFFGGDPDKVPTRFDLSPDLTCLIGGSMTGKSTFLDGLRTYIQAELPDDDQLRRQVQVRGQELFLGGSPNVRLECPGQDSTDAIGNQWPAVFYTQNELQRSSLQSSMVEDILARLVATETQAIAQREKRIAALDRQLATVAKHLVQLDEDVAEAEQACTRAHKAAGELAAISDAGIDDLHRAARWAKRWQETENVFRELAGNIEQISDTAAAVEVPWQDDELTAMLKKPSSEERELGAQRWHRACDMMHTAKTELGAAHAVAKEVAEALGAQERSIREDVGRRLAELGLDRARINEFQSLSRQAGLLPSYQAALNHAKEEREAAEGKFHITRDSRQKLIAEQRSAFDRVSAGIEKQFEGRILVRRVNEGNRDPLQQFLTGLKQRGVSRWWNDLPDEKRPTATALLERIDADQLAAVGMSSSVQATFQQSLTPPLRRELEAIRCRDRYLLEMKLDDSNSRPLHELSGGQRVSMLLSLLLETNDNRPLVIDQPEDELDNRFLFDTVLPALKRLKGKRQILVATHDPNIVVNGDADQVIQLEATASRGKVAHAGVIDEASVRDAIVQTVDGGDEAFRLRQRKYGF